MLLVELGVAIASGATAQVGARAVEPREVGVALYGPYAIGVELASTLLLAALIGARHLGQRQRELDADALAAAAAAFGPDGPRPDAGGQDGGGPAGAPGEGPPGEGQPAREVGLAEPAAAAEELTPAPRSVRFWRKDDD